MALFLSAQFAYAQDSLNVNSLGRLTYPNTGLNDVWGYADANGNEYALVGAVTGFSVVDVTDPSNPTEKVFIPGASSVWRDMKTWDHYAYVIHDSYSGNSDGIMIVDMDSVNQTVPKFKRWYPVISVDTVTYIYDRSHNIYVDENGVLYVFGASIANGGALMFDLTQDPENPTYLGIFDDFYLHDGMVRGDTLWGSAIYAGQLLIVDVLNKTSPSIIGSTSTPNTFTHNAWISDDNNTVYTTDERSGAFITAYDVSDPSTIQELDRIQVSYDSAVVIPHNTHVYGDFLVTSYYTAGLHIVDATLPNVLIETAYYDTSPLTGGGFQGAWGAYPYLPSGNILVTDRQRGLFVLNTDYPRACYFTGLVKDSLTGNSLVGAQLTFQNANLSASTDIFGEFATGILNGGNYQIVVSRAGYRNDTIMVNLSSGVEVQRTIALLPFNFSIDENSLLQELDVSPNPSKNQFTIAINEGIIGGMAELTVRSINGQVLMNQKIDLSNRSFTLDHNLKPGSYVLSLKNDQQEFQPTKILVIE